MSYIKLTEEEIQRAGNIDLVEFLKSQGEILKQKSSYRPAKIGMRT